MILPLLRLEALLAAHRKPLLGEITKAVGQEISSIKRAENIPLAWDRFDSEFAERQDYRLWRKLERPQYNSHILESWPDLPVLVETGLNSTEPEVVWGTMAVLGGILTGKRIMIFTRDQVTALAAAAEHRMYSNLPPVQGGEHGCTLVKLFLAAATQKLYYQLYSTPGKAAIADYLRTLESLLIEVDRSWKPGKSINWNEISRVGYGADSSRSVLPFSPMEITLRLQQVLFSVRGAIRAAINEYDDDALGLLKTGYLYSMSAWMTLRSVRISMSKRGGHHRLDLDRLQHDECMALLRCSQAARDVGYTLESARMAHFLLRVIPKGLQNHKDFLMVGDIFSYIIREAGLEVDNRFRRTLRASHTRRPSVPDYCAVDPSEVAATQCIPEHPVIATPTEILDTMDKAKHAPTPPANFYLLRLQRDMVCLPEWQALSRRYTSKIPDRLLKRALDDVINTCQTDQEYFSSTLRLCIKYGRLRSAAEVLRILAYYPSKSDFMNFADAVNRAIQNLPFGIDLNTLYFWQTTLRRRYLEVDARESFTPLETCFIHELVLGRSLTNILGSGDDGARLLTRKYFGEFDEDEIRDTLDLDYSAKISGQKTVKAIELASFIRTAGRSSLWPVCASIVTMSESQHSLVLLDPRGGVRAEMFQKEGLRSYARRIMQFLTPFLSEWAHSPLLPWGEVFGTLCKTIHEKVEGVTPGYSWLMLAVDSTLARLPWQDLWSDAPRKDVVVSLIPSLSWAAMNHKRVRTNSKKKRIWLSSDADLVETSRYIEDTLSWARLPTDCSLAVILGHGLVNDAGMPAVKVDGRLLSMDDWIQISEQDIVIVHSCYSGYMTSSATGDFSGMAGMLLGLGVRVVCAPVAEVSERCARVLQKHLMSIEGSREIGARYLSAVREDPEVALYNLYGFADEPIRE